MKKKSGEREEVSGPEVKKKPGGRDEGNQKPTSEVSKMGTMWGWHLEELASSEVVGLAEVVPQPRMRRAYTRISSLKPVTAY